jgi:hypothetical protein
MNMTAASALRWILNSENNEFSKERFDSSERLFYFHLRQSA